MLLVLHAIETPSAKTVERPSDLGVEEWLPELVRTFLNIRLLLDVETGDMASGFWFIAASCDLAV
jgi:hypothetical protein